MKQHLYVGSEPLKDDDEIREAIKNGTLVIGFIGLAEALKIVTGKHHGQSDEAWELGYEIIEHLSDTCVRYSTEEQLNFVSYATPAEGLSGRFPVLDRKSFGIIDGITDKDYYTNSFHIPVDYNISMFDKIAKEGPFHKITTAGHFRTVEMHRQPD